MTAGILDASTMEHALSLPAWVEENARVGWRAELYSLRLERARLGSDKVLHVSRDVGDDYGYDIETTTDPSRYIQVKGSRSRRLTFFLTANELATARRNPEEYELQFWGEISLGLDPADEFGLLVERGYPLVLTDVADAFDGGGWSVECSSWHVEVCRLTRACRSARASLWLVDSVDRSSGPGHRSSRA